MRANCWHGKRDMRIEQVPDHPGILFNLACLESHAGRRDEAIAHLERAIVRYPRNAEYARTDPDFDPIRDDPRFPA